MRRKLTPSQYELYDNKDFKGAWVLLEYHDKKCECSYCQETKPGIRLTLPTCKMWNAWRRVSFMLFGVRVYLRWTMPKTPERMCKVCGEHCPIGREKIEKRKMEMRDIRWRK